MHTRLLNSIAPLAASAFLGAMSGCSAAREMSVHARQESITREINAMAADETPGKPSWAREWAGDYYVGDGTGMNVRVLLGPMLDLVYTWNGCLGLYDSGIGTSEGSFDEDGDGAPDGLLINWTSTPSPHYKFASRKWYMVRWPGPNGGEGRRYLVPEDQMMELVNNFNEGGFARDGLYSAPRKMERVEGRTQVSQSGLPPVAGAPQLPRAWAALLIPAPLDAHVTRVSPIAAAEVANTNLAKSQTLVTLDKGRADRLHTGMTIRVGGYSPESGRLNIHRVTEHEAEGTFETINSRGMMPTPLVVGQAIRIGGASESME